jgi:hypothetical protein
MKKQRYKLSCTGFIAIICLLTLGSNAVFANKLYKIINERGNVELKATLSAQEAKRGYSVLSPDGQLIETVAPELSAEEYAALSKERRAALNSEQREKEEQAYNESLLLRYSNVDDLYAEQRRKLQELDIRVSILINNRAALREKIEAQQATAANYERRNVKVPEVLEQNIVQLESEIKETDAEIKLRKIEKAQTSERYAADAERLTELIERFGQY